jgi:pimeloyl-ACP methyl ester carboxylesterase
VDAPAWFDDALAAPREEDEVVVDGCPVHYVRWGDRDCPGIVLVHGGAAHAHWWDHIAPFLSPACNVVAIDLSGHGDSGRRDRYPTSTWADEIVAVAEDAGVTGKPVVIAH